MIEKLIFFTVLFSISSINNSYAYLGLGPLIPVLGNIILFLFVGFISILGFLYYPLKKIKEYTKNKIKNKKKSGSN